MTGNLTDFDLPLTRQEHLTAALSHLRDAQEGLHIWQDRQAIVRAALLVEGLLAPPVRVVGLSGPCP